MAAPRFPLSAKAVERIRGVVAKFELDQPERRAEFNRKEKRFFGGHSSNSTTAKGGVRP
jgi:hypothetical protein